LSATAGMNPPTMNGYNAFGVGPKRRGIATAGSWFTDKAVTYPRPCSRTQGNRVNRAVVHGHQRKASDVVRVDIDKGRRLPAGSSWPCRAEAERVEPMSESIIRRLGELCEATT
jgi:hypothetical protein